MKTRWFLVVIAGLWALLRTERTLAEHIVYDNTATYAGTSLQVSDLALGSEITLAGTQRVVREVTIAVETVGDFPVPFIARLTLSLNDGQFGETPGTLLWRGDVVPQHIEPGGPRFIRFAVPGVLAPDTLIWTVEVFDWKTPIKLSQFYPPRVGSVRFGIWRRTTGPVKWLFFDEVTPFGALLTVDPPIPAISQWGALLMTVALLCAGTVIISRANKRGSSVRPLAGATMLPVLSFIAWASGGVVMNTKWILRVIAGSGALLVTERTLAETVVYDNTVTYTGTSVEVLNVEMGNEITLAGTQRVVRAVAVVVEVQGQGSAAFIARLSLYVNDGGPNGRPGTLLWQSDGIPQQIEPGAPRFISFAVPGVSVPDTFIWTLGFFAWKTPISISEFNPPAVGSARFGFWRSSLGPIPWLFYEGETPLGAVVTVDPPIPTISQWGALLMTLALVIAGAVVISRANRRRSTPCTLAGAALLPELSFLAWASSALAQVQVGPQIRIDVNGGTAAANETSMASSNFNPNEIVAVWNDWRESTPTTEFIRMGVAVSNDCGVTWSDFLVRPPPAYQSNRELDPMTAYDDRTGTLWVGAIALGSTTDALYVARKIPGQNAFEPSVVADTAIIIDKGWMAAGPAPGNPTATNVYIAYNLGVLRSTDMGDTWSGPVPLGGGIGFLPRVGPNGELYVAYFDEFQGVRLKRSFNGGQTFGSGITIATRNDTWPLQDVPPLPRFPGNFRVWAFSYLAVDQNDGTLYCVYFDTTNYVNGTCNGNCNVDLYFTKSTNQGATGTWTTPVVINGDGNPPGDQFFPWIEVDEESNLHMVFLDSRHTVQNDDAIHGMIDAYYSFSNDGGATWQEFRLTPA